MNTSAKKDTFVAALPKIYGVYTGGFIAFIIVLAIAEQMGLPAKVIGWCFMAATVGLYAIIGIWSRTGDVAEYYVAGRRVPAFFNLNPHAWPALWRFLATGQ